VASGRILAEAGLKKGEADLLIGGPPCQPFSKSGYWNSGDSARLDDPRANTLAEYLRVLRDTKPKAFLLENVAGLAYSGKSEGIRFLRAAIKDINSEIGTAYSFQVKLLKAVEHGVPQLRERVFVVGARDGTEFRFPRPTHRAFPDELDMFEPATQPYRTAWDALGRWTTAPPDIDETAMRGKWADLLPSIPEGLNYLHHTDRGEGLPLFGWRRRFWSFLLKLAKDRPSWTITAQPGPAIGPFHWANRRLARRELAALQTFPAGYKLAGSLGDVQRQLGNAVPSLLAEVLALEIRRQLLGDKEAPHKPSLLPPRRRNTPPASLIAPVHEKYLPLVGKHEAHPGTGLGYGAIRRSAESG
jgi:DNA (cytosine-5)-methyltransferase 1